VAAITFTTGRPSSRRRVTRILALGVLLVVLWGLAGPSQLGGPTSYITTHGVSMAPEFTDGDLAIVRSTDRYRVGDVAAYRSPLFHAVIMHRIVKVHRGRYTFQGDHNSWVDPETPTAAQMIGRQVARIPQGGTWMHRLASPAALGLYTFLLIGGGGTTIERRRRRTRRQLRSTPMSLTRRRHGVATAVSTLTPSLQIAAAVTTTVGLLATILAIYAWTAPVREVSHTDQKSARQMTFAYSAPVRRSAAYDGTRAASPQPIFRKLADIVDVRYTYHGPAGSIVVNATLSTASGWTSTVPLEAATRFTGDTHVGATRLHLSALQARADAAAKATGLPNDQILVTLAPTVTSTNGTVFTPTLRLTLDPLALSLAGSPNTLRVAGTSTTTSSTDSLNTLSLLGIQVPVYLARLLSLLVLLLSLLAAGAIVTAARRTRPSGEVEEIRRRWSSLMVRVHPVHTPQGRPIVDVAEPATLVKLAERYGLLILHWTRSDIETYVVQDDAITYRYRTGGSLDADSPETLERSASTGLQDESITATE
jgi:signal peptidase I